MAVPLRQPGMDPVAEALRAASARAMKAKSKQHPSKMTPANAGPGQCHHGYRGNQSLEIVVLRFGVTVGTGTITSRTTIQDNIG